MKKRVLLGVLILVLAIGLVPGNLHGTTLSVSGAAEASTYELYDHLYSAKNIWEEYGLTGEGITIGFIDTGALVKTVPWIEESWRGHGEKNFSFHWVDYVEGSRTPIDGDGYHGSQVLNVAIGKHSRIVPDAKWIMARASPYGFENYSEAIEKALAWMAAPGGDESQAPQIVSVSMLIPDTEEIGRELANLKERGIFVVAAAGNSGPREGTIEASHNSPNIFSVGALEADLKLARFSSRGNPGWEHTKPDLVAPGNLWVTRSTSYPTYFKGTSASTPVVAGAAALLLEANPTLGVDELASILRETAMPAADENYDVYPNNGYGYGILNIKAAVESALDKIAELELITP